jgi:acetoin utilization deacetylase AcuC-like enzyme
MPLKVFYHTGFAAPIGPHIMPMRKFGLVAEALGSDPEIELIPPAPVTEQDLLRVHTLEYLQAVKTGEPQALAESQKFPWSPLLYPSVLLTNGGLLAASHEALKAGSSAALASGFHHSHSKRGEGFCTFNGLVVALEALKEKKKIQRAAVLDMDLHYGNGTAILARERSWLQVLSFYGNDYWNNTAYRDVSMRQHEDGPNHQSVALPAGCDSTLLRQLMDEYLPQLVVNGKPDLLLYQAGADPYFEDPYSPLSLDHAALFERDRRVFEFTRRHQIPIAWVLAGGYTQDLSKVVQVHVNTFKAWKKVYEQGAIIAS